MYIGIGVLTLLAVIRSIIFNRRNKKRVNNGESIRYFSLREEKIHNIAAYVVGGVIVFAYIMFGIVDTVASAVIMLIYLVIIAIVILLVLFVRKHSKLSRVGNIVTNIGISLVACSLIIGSIIVFVIYLSYTDMPLEKNEKKITYIDEKTNRKETALITIDKLPVSAKDLSNVDDDCMYFERWCDEYKTLFGSFYKCEEIQYDKSMTDLGKMIDYEVLKTKVGFIKDSYINKFIKHGDAVNMIEDSKEEAKKWNADKVYMIKMDDEEDTYDSAMIVYNDTVVFLEASTVVFNQENIDVFYNKLVK
jgi:ABC-type multidrug transport system fused ATPase/permease subunit